MCIYGTLSFGNNNNNNNNVCANSRSQEHQFKQLVKNLMIIRNCKKVETKNFQ